MFNQLFGQLFSDSVNAHGFAADKVENALGSLCAAEQTAAAVAILFSVFFIGVRTADRTEFRHHEISGVFRPEFRNHSDDLRNDVAGTMHDDSVSDLDAHVLQEFFVVQRNVADCGSSDKHRFQTSDRCKFARSSHLNSYIQNLGLDFFRRILMSYCPARLSGDKTQLFLAGKTVDLVDHAVNIKR